MATKRDKARFVKVMEQLLKERGARPSTFYEWEMDTPYGVLEISVRTSAVDEFLGMVFSRFVKLDKGKSFGANPFSGKWNHAYLKGWTLATALADFKWQLERVIGEKA